jgi:hypothetical protein
MLGKEKQKSESHDTEEIIIMYVMLESQDTEEIIIIYVLLNYLGNE